MIDVIIVETRCQRYTVNLNLRHFDHGIRRRGNIPPLHGFIERRIASRKYQLKAPCLTRQIWQQTYIVYINMIIPMYPKGHDSAYYKLNLCKIDESLPKMLWLFASIPFATWIVFPALPLLIHCIIWDQPCRRNKSIFLLYRSHVRQCIKISTYNKEDIHNHVTDVYETLHVIWQNGAHRGKTFSIPCQI